MEGGEQKQVRMRAGGKRPTDPRKAAFLPPTLAPLPDANNTLDNTTRYCKANDRPLVACRSHDFKVTRQIQEYSSKFCVLVIASSTMIWCRTATKQRPAPT